ncbi:MAG: hypothetical protein WC369_04835 [Dehalococcoidales bacterium]|jgi:hypothetical protein
MGVTSLIAKSYFTGITGQREMGDCWGRMIVASPPDPLSSSKSGEERGKLLKKRGKTLLNTSLYNIAVVDKRLQR